MFHQLVSHNDDIRRLVEKGCAVAFDSKCMVVRDIPYLDVDKKLRVGAFVTKLVFVDLERVKQDDHQVFFAGGVPCGLDGKPIANLGGGPATLRLTEACKDVVVVRSFSHKLMASGKVRDYVDFTEKILNYINVISGPAMELHSANPFTYHVVKEVVADSIFKVHDTLTSRAEIADLSAKFRDDVVAIIGLGGTGSYVLDFLAKTPVKEIRAFDLDYYHVHNAFRSPGRLELSDLGEKKAKVYTLRYENFRNGLCIVPKGIDATSVDEMNGVTFAFVCVDKATSRAGIFDLLLSKGIPFIDVGMGLNRKHGPLGGMLRATYYSTADGHKVRDKGLAELSADADDLYKTNIQIGELNALNACLAVVRFKQLRGFYLEETPHYHLALNIGNLKVVGASDVNEN